MGLLIDGDPGECTSEIVGSAGRCDEWQVHFMGNCIYKCDLFVLVLY